MSDLNLGQAAWDRLHREEGFFFGALKLLRDVQRRFSLDRLRTQIVEENDTNGSTSAWTLAGVVFGTNTNEDGRLFVRIQDETPGAGQARVQLFRAAGGGGGDLVAQGEGADSTTLVLAAQNASGLTGTVAIGVVTASEANDLHRLLAFPDFIIRARTLFNLTAAGHGTALDAWIDATAAIFTTLGTAQDAVISAYETWVSESAAATLRASDPESGALINRVPADAGDGVIETTFRGLLELWRDDMEDETVPGPQTVRRNVVTAAAGVFDAQNQGQGVLLAPSLYEWARDGLMTLVCVDATIGRERFAISQRDDVTGEVLVGEQQITVKRPYSSPALGIQSLVITRTLTLTGAVVDFGVVADWAIDDESAAVTDSGRIYLRVQVNPSDATQFRVNGYSDSGRTVQVLTTAFVVAGTLTPIVAVGSGLSGTARVGAAPTNNNVGDINLNVFRTQNAAGVPDKITVDVTVTSRGQFGRILGEELGYRHHSTVGAPTITDSYVSAGTFPPYQVEDA